MDVQDLRNYEAPQVDLQPITVIHGGMCFRVVLIPAGTCAAGATLGKPSMMVISGDVSVACGDSVVRYTGFHIVPAAAGVTRAAAAHEDSFVLCAHQTDETTLDGALAEMVGAQLGLLQNKGMFFLGGSA